MWGTLDSILIFEIACQAKMRICGGQDSCFPWRSITFKPKLEWREFLYLLRRDLNLRKVCQVNQHVPGGFTLIECLECKEHLLKLNQTSRHVKSEVSVRVGINCYWFLSASITAALFELSLFWRIHYISSPDALSPIRAYSPFLTGSSLRNMNGINEMASICSATSAIVVINRSLHN